MLLIVEAHVGVAGRLIHQHVIEGCDEAIVARLQDVD